MISIHIIRERKGHIRQFVIKGHAGYGEKGSDIVCAAVSAIAYTALGALDELAGIRNCYTERDGYMSCNIPGDIPKDKKETVRVILETAAVGFKQIEHEYGDYVLVLDEEV